MSAVTAAAHQPTTAPARPPGNPPNGGKKLLRRPTIQSRAREAPQITSAKPEGSQISTAPDESSEDCDDLPVARFLSNDTGRKLYSFFQRWDTDGSGTLSKNEFCHIMTSIGGSSISQEDMEAAWVSVDKDKSGVVEYYELLEWALEPGCQLTFAEQEGAQYAVAPFSLREVLEPLFDAFDLNGDGSISRDEFRHAHGVLHGAIASFSTSGYSVHEPTVHVPACLQDPDRIFDKWDLDQSSSIGKDEFVAWQRESIRKSGLSNEDLAVLCPSLAKHLRSVFRFIQAHDDDSGLDELESAALQTMVKAVADQAMELWSAEKCSGQVTQGVEDETFCNNWRTPPVGINVNKLIATMLQDSPMPFRPNDIHSRMHILCIPALGREDEWLAEVDSRIPEDAQYYVYRKASFTWEATEDKAQFQESLENLAPEAQFFCLMKTEGNFAADISWVALNHALSVAIERGLVTQGQVAAYKQALESEALQHFCEDQAAESVVRKLSIPMVTVLAKFCELGAFPLRRVWEDFMERQE